MSLTVPEKQIVQVSLGATYTVHDVTTVKLYQSNENTWKYFGLGAIALCTESNSSYLNPSSSNLARNYSSTSNIKVGLSFADEKEAETFFRSVQKILGNINSRNFSSNLKTSPPSAELDHSAKKDKKEKKSKKSFFSKVFQKEEADDLLVISEPSNFRHESSIGWSADKGFEIRNIPVEWRKLFQAAGIKKRELKDKETAQYLMNVIEENGGLSQMGYGSVPQTGAPPPPPPSSLPSRNAPPPPPPSYAAPTSAAPPPPAPPPAPPSHAPGIPAPPPPTPPSSYNSYSTDQSDRGALLDQIQKGTNLKKVTAQESAPFSNPPPSGLAQTLARAMETRRLAITEEVDEDEDSDWSDG